MKNSQVLTPCNFHFSHHLPTGPLDLAISPCMKDPRNLKSGALCRTMAMAFLVFVKKHVGYSLTDDGRSRGRRGRPPRGGAGGEHGGSSRRS
ncbi:hypothetical protein RHGRI_013578 [Rhododendron griersonianum]|uniref:Uncharacterized protein n=1 Tax=Rhododendron griersonianum TaxID=479676 RepID=A0AAV6K6G5_9ERIC|nr:hypothetical protein RHGRI_013578 [Rhododendron griersonianum]